MSASNAPVVERWTPAELEVVVANTTTRRGVNPYGFVPFIHVPNLPLPNQPWGQSDLVDVVPINRELDERVSDQSDVIRFHADPPIVFYSTRPAVVVNINGAPIWDPIAGTDLDFAVNTNWDLFKHQGTDTLYLRDGTFWL